MDIHKARKIRLNLEVIFANVQPDACLIREGQGFVVELSVSDVPTNFMQTIVNVCTRNGTSVAVSKKNGNEKEVIIKSA